MQASARRAKRAVRALGQRGLRERIPDPVRRQVLAYAEEARRAGESWPEIAATVGLSKSALIRWRRKPASSAGALRRVRVGPPAPEVRELAVVTVTGHRIEGLSLAEVVAVVRALG